MDLNLNKNPNKKRKGKIKVDDTFIYGYIPPQDIKAEKAILGALTLEPKAIAEVFSILNEDSFYVEAHQQIYNACATLFRKNKPIDIITLTDELKIMGCLETIGGPYYLTQLQDGITKASNLKYHALIVEERAIKRRLISAAAQALQDLYSDENDVFEVKDRLQEDIYKSTSKIQQVKKVTLDHIAYEFLEEVQRGMDGGGMTGIPFGIQEIDEILGGAQKQNLIMIAARPRHGKSAVASAFMSNLTRIKNPNYDPKIHKTDSLYKAGYLSAEMRNTELFARLVSNELYEMGYRIPYSRIRKGLITLDELNLVNVAIDRLVKKGIYLDDTPALTVSIIKSKIMRLIEEFGVNIIFIDYVQLIQIGNKLFSNNAENISQNMTDLKNMAKEFDIPIVLLSQVGRETEKHGVARKAVLGELKGSGGLEEKTDVVMILYYPEINEPNPTDENGLSLRGVMIIDIAKNKMGETKELKIPFDLKTNAFEHGDGVMSAKMEQFLQRPIF